MIQNATNQILQHSGQTCTVYRKTSETTAPGSTQYTPVWTAIETSIPCRVVERGTQTTANDSGVKLENPEDTVFYIGGDTTPLQAADEIEHLNAKYRVSRIHRPNHMGADFPLYQKAFTRKI